MRICRGYSRWWIALRSFYPGLSEWKTRFYLDADGFELRSHRAVQYVQQFAGQVDAILQIGALFSVSGVPIPKVLYLDYTAQLGLQNRGPGWAFRQPPEPRRWLALEREVYEHAAHICARSQMVRASLVEQYGIPAERISVVGGGVNFSPLPVVPDRSRRSIQQGAHLLFIGKDFYRKGGDLLLDAFVKIHAELPQTRLTLVTNLPSAKKSLPAGASVLPPTWDRAKIAWLYAHADIFVLPSRLETWGDVLPEAMSFGLPCVGVRADAMDEIIQHQVTGLVVPPGDLDALTDALLLLLRNPQLCQSYGLNGRRRVETALNWDRVAESLEQSLAFFAKRR